MCTTHCCSPSGQRPAVRAHHVLITQLSYRVTDSTGTRDTPLRAQDPLRTSGLQGTVRVAVRRSGSEASCTHTAAVSGPPRSRSSTSCRCPEGVPQRGSCRLGQSPHHHQHRSNHSAAQLHGTQWAQFELEGIRRTDRRTHRASRTAGLTPRGRTRAGPHPSGTLSVRGSQPGP